MIAWIAIGTLFGALLCIAGFAWDWFGVRSMIEEDIRDAYRDASVDRDWEILSRRREDDWPLLDERELDVWEAFGEPAVDPGAGHDDDVWAAFSEDPEKGQGRA